MSSLWRRLRTPTAELVNGHRVTEDMALLLPPQKFVQAALLNLRSQWRAPTAEQVSTRQLPKKESVIDLSPKGFWAALQHACLCGREDKKSL